MIGIYRISNKINNQHYIGQSLNIEGRWKEHINNISRKNNSIYQALREYGIDNFEFKVVEECAEHLLDDREKYWIEYYDSFNNGYNMTKGGGHSKKLDYDFLVSQYLLHGTLEKTAKKCNCHTNTVSKALKAYHITPNANSLGVHRPVKQIDPVTLEVVAVYDSIAQAAKAMGVNNNAAISKVLAGNMQAAYGYIWKDIDDNNIQPIKIKTMHTNQVLQQLDKDTEEIIAIYPSVKAALIALGKNLKDGGIYKVCKGKAKTAYGYKWRFAEGVI